MAEKTKWTISITPAEDILISTMADAEDVSKSELIRKALKEFVSNKEVLTLLEELLRENPEKLELLNNEEVRREEPQQ